MLIRIPSILVLATLCFPLYASVQLGTTRVIYHAEEKNISIHIDNPGKHPVLLQSWIDNGNPEIKPEKINTPFILTPPLTRVNENAGQTLRLSFIGSNLPMDKESVYWLNVLEIPPAENNDSNKIQVAFRSRIKIFYRPKSLTDKGAQQAPSQLRWSQQDEKLTVTNPTPYFISSLALTVYQSGKKVVLPLDMIAPESKTIVSLPKSSPVDYRNAVSIDTINDYGASVSQIIQQ